MPFQVAFAWSDESEAEMKAKGFVKREVYIKQFYGEPSAPNSTVMCEQGDADFFRMSRPPFQFKTTDYWGAGNGD